MTHSLFKFKIVKILFNFCIIAKPYFFFFLHKHFLIMMHNNFTKQIFSFCFFILLSLSVFSQNEEKISGTILDSETGDGLYGVSIVVQGSTNGSSTDASGNFSINAKIGDKLEISFIGYQTKVVSVNGAKINETLIYQGVTLSSFSVVGSRNIARAALETPNAVDKIDIQTLSQNTAKPNINRMLNVVAPSFNANVQNISDGTDHIDPASLRGLGPDQVLVLLNGKRRHTTSLVNVNGTFGRGNVGTDMNAIPAMAVKRIDILRDGAAAQYGSDAIAGVINVVLKSSVNEFSAYAGTGSHFSKEANEGTGGNDGTSYNIGFNYGVPLGNKGGFVNFTGQFDERDYFNRMKEFEGSIYALYNTRERSQTEFDNLYEGQLTEADKAVFSTGYLNSAANKDLTVEVDGNNITGQERHNEILLTNTTDRELSARNLTRSDFNMRVGQSAITNTGFFINMGAPTSEKTSFYANAGLNYRNGESAGFYRLPNQNRTVTSVYQNGFLPEIHSNIFDYSLTLGIKGKKNDWFFDLSNTFGGNNFQFQIENTHNASLENATKTSYNSGGHYFNQNTLNADVSRNFKDILEGFNFAFGGEVRLDNYGIFAGEEGSYANYGLANSVDVQDDSGNVIGTSVVPSLTGSVSTVFDQAGRSRPGGAQVFPGFKPSNEVNAFRNNLSIYTDLELDVTKDFLINGALRYEKFSDFGSTTNGKLATRYKIQDIVTLRASFATGFRAPSLHQQYFNSTSTVFISGIPVESGTFRNDSRAAELLGIPKLKEETSNSFSGGATFSLKNTGLSITLDGYTVEIKDRVVLTGNFKAEKDNNGDYETLEDEELGRLLGAANASTARFFVNAIDTRTNGFDAVVSYKKDLGSGTLNADLSGTISQTKQIGEVKASEKLKTKLSTYFDEVGRINLENAVPNTKFNLRLAYSTKTFSTALTNTYYGETTESSNDIASQQVFSAKIVTDLSGSVKIMKKYTFALGINNLLDIYPDELAPSNLNYSSGRFRYTRRSPQFGIGGRYLFTRLSISI